MFSFRNYCNNITLSLETNVERIPPFGKQILEHQILHLKLKYVSTPKSGERKNSTQYSLAYCTLPHCVAHHQYLYSVGEQVATYRSQEQLVEKQVLQHDEAAKTKGVKSQIRWRSLFIGESNELTYHRTSIYDTRSNRVQISFRKS